MRRALIAAFAVATLLAAAWTVWWNAVAARSDEWLAAWTAPTPGKAWHGTYGRTEVSGFPFSLDLRIIDPAVTWRDGVEKAIWQGPWLVARFRPWALSSFSLDLPSEQTVTVENGAVPRQVVVGMTRGDIAVERSDGEVRSLSGVFERVALTYGGDRASASAERLDIAVAALDGGAAYEADIAVRGLGLAGRAVPPFDAVAAGIETTLRWIGPLPGNGPLVRRLDSWRKAGGVVEVAGLSLDWSPLDIEATGTLALDGRLRPIGALRVDIAGYRDLLDALEKSGGLERNRTRLVGSALDLMATRQADGRMRLTVDVSIQNGMLSVGPVPVMPVRPVLPTDVGF